MQFLIVGLRSPSKVSSQVAATGFAGATADAGAVTGADASRVAIESEAPFSKEVQKHIAGVGCNRFSDLAIAY